MADKFPALDERLTRFIEAQHMYFVATACAEGYINLSPKGMDSLRVLNEKRVIWLNPEPKSSWTVGDAEMKKYAPCCHQAEVCNSLTHLERVVANLLKVAR